MKGKRFLANLDKDTICFMTVVMLYGCLAGVVGMSASMAQEMASGGGAEKKDTVEVCDGICVDAQLPARTNTGDTLYVIGKGKNRKNVLLAMPLHGREGIYEIQGAEKVQPGDTIVYNSKHNFLMKNITQRNFERQK